MTTAFTDGVIGAIRLGTIVGLCLCGFLLYRQMSGSLETLGGCNNDVWTCEEIFKSRWGAVLGIPVVALAVLNYFAMFVLSMAPVRKLGRYSDVILGALGITLLVGSLWFVGLQVYFGLKCLFCMLAQFVGIVVGGIVLKSLCEAIHFRVKVSALATFAMSGLFTLILIGGHFASSGNDLSEGNDAELVDGDQRFEDGFYKFPNLGLSVERGKFPTIGNPKAEKAVVVMLDYSTPSSQRIHAHITTLVDTLGEELAVILVPVPLDKDCNENWPSADSANACQIATYAYAAWEANPRIYQAYHNYLMHGGAYSESGSIAGVVWHDANSNGMRDADERGITKVKLDLIRSLNITTPLRGTSNDSGQFVFGNLDVGRLDMQYQIRIPDGNFEDGGALEGMINTAGAGDVRNTSESYELTSSAATLTGRNFGFVETSRYDKAVIGTSRRSDAFSASSEAALDPLVSELFRLAGDKSEKIASLLPDFSAMESTSDTSEDEQEDWRDLGNPVLERLLAGTTIYGDMQHVLKRLPTVIFGADQLRSGVIEESPKEFASKVRSTSGLAVR